MTQEFDSFLYPVLHEMTVGQVSGSYVTLQLLHFAFIEYLNSQLFSLTLIKKLLFSL